MGDIELREDRLIVDRKPNQLDTLALGCSAMLNRLDINHVFVAGYVAILVAMSVVLFVVPYLIYAALL